MKKMSPLSRILLATGSLSLIIVYFIPVWSIYLIAPQYPEGLSMQIWLNKITGQVDIINGLNHYIGMKHIKAEMFPEFSYLVYILGCFILLGIIIAVTGKRKLLFAYLVISLAGAVAAMVDFYLWGYDYGHDLDPEAAIQVPGLSYQPPLLGHKKLLNFDSYSYPDSGGWVIVGVTALFFLIWFFEWRKNKSERKMAAPKKYSLTLATLILALFVMGCNPKPEKLVPGKDNCAECKMTLVDARFGAEIVTKKSKVFKFDDAHCVAAFLQRRGVALDDIHQTLIADYNNPDRFIKVDSAEFVVSSTLKSPMGGNAAAFSSHQEANSKAATIDGSRITNWATLYNVLVK